MSIVVSQVFSPKTTFPFVKFCQWPGWLQEIDMRGSEPKVGNTPWGSVAGKMTKLPARGALRYVTSKGGMGPRGSLSDSAPPSRR